MDFSNRNWRPSSETSVASPSPPSYSSFYYRPPPSESFGSPAASSSMTSSPPAASEVMDLHDVDEQNVPSSFSEKDEKSSNPLISPTEKCKVCLEPAARHIHYGAVTCFSCRAFFRRSIQNKTAQTYVCRRDKSCEINLKTRKNCQACRYQKCLDVGMKPSWVLSEEERFRRFRKNREKLMRQKQPSPRNAPMPPPPPSNTFGETFAPPPFRPPPPKPETGFGGFIRPHLPPLPPIGPGAAIFLNFPLNFARALPLSDPRGPPIWQHPAASSAPVGAPASSFSPIAEEESSNDGSSDGTRGGSPPLVISEPIMTITDEELATIEMISHKYDNNYKSVSFGETLIKELIMSSTFGIPMSVKGAMTGYRMMIQRVTKVSQGSDIFLDQNLAIQAALLKENADLLVSLRAAVFFDSRKKGLDQILMSMGVEDVNAVKDIITPIIKSGNLKHIDYHNFNSIQKLNMQSESEKRYNTLVERVGKACSNDKVLKILTFIVLFSPDFADIQDNRSHIESLQQIYITMLQRYLFSQYSRPIALKIFANALLCIADLREMTYIKKQRSLSSKIDIDQAAGATEQQQHQHSPQQREQHTPDHLQRPDQE